MYAMLHYMYVSTKLTGVILFNSGEGVWFCFMYLVLMWLTNLWESLNFGSIMKKIGPVVRSIFEVIKDVSTDVIMYAVLLVKQYRFQVVFHLQYAVIIDHRYYQDVLRT